MKMFDNYFHISIKVPQLPVVHELQLAVNGQADYDSLQFNLKTVLVNLACKCCTMFGKSELSQTPNDLLCYFDCYTEGHWGT